MGFTGRDLQLRGPAAGDDEHLLRPASRHGHAQGRWQRLTNNNVIVSPAQVGPGQRSSTRAPARSTTRRAGSTLPNGTVYVISTTNGLESITDPERPDDTDFSRRLGNELDGLLPDDPARFQRPGDVDHRPDGAPDQVRVRLLRRPGHRHRPATATSPASPTTPITPSEQVYDPLGREGSESSTTATAVSPRSSTPTAT